jgi:hypothetical protein
MVGRDGSWRHRPLRNGGGKAKGGSDNKKRSGEDDTLNSYVPIEFQLVSDADHF